MTQLSTHAQRVHSLLTGEDREHPIHPIRRSPGAIHIGNRRIIVRPPRYISSAMLDAGVEAWNASRQPHECAAMLVGEFCTHQE